MSFLLLFGALLAFAEVERDDVPEQYKPYLFGLVGLLALCATLVAIFGKDD